MKPSTSKYPLSEPSIVAGDRTLPGIVCRRSKVMLFARQRGQSSNDHGAYRALL